MNHSQTLTRSPRLRCRRVGDEGVVLHLDQPEALVVNEVGLFLLECLRRPRTRCELVAATIEAFDVSADCAERDIDFYIADLAKRGLLAAPA